jgi:hypothetical protein
MGTGLAQLNPYTREPLNEGTLKILHDRIEWLRSRKYQIRYISTDVLTPEQVWNQRVLDVFLKIEGLGYYVSCDWFHELIAYQHAALYSRLFNLWNYRLGLTPAQKDEIVPRHNGTGEDRLFRYIPETLPRKDKHWWERHNIAILDALVSRAEDKDHRKLGALYVLMGLVQVSLPAARSLPWVAETVLN